MSKGNGKPLQIAREQEKPIKNNQELTDEEALALLRNPKVRTLLMSLAEFQQGDGSLFTAMRQQQDNQTGLDKVMKEIRNKHKKKDLEYAKFWVERFFAPLIKISDTGSMGRETGVKKPHIMLCVIVGSDKTRELGLTNQPDGWKKHIGIFAEHFALYYIDVILAGRDKKKSDKEIMLDIVQYAKDNPHLHYEQLKYLVNMDDPADPKLEMWTHIIE